MYRIYTTDGFVMSSRPQGEASKLLTLLTEELGLIRVHAQGVRELKSKLRYHIQDESRATFSLVRGREYWRLTSASSLEQASFPDPQAKRLFVRLLRFLERLVHGEEKDPPVFHLFADLSHLLREVLTAEELSRLELLVSLQLLHRLGYIAPNRSDMVLGRPLSRVTLQELAYEEEVMRDTITTALAASQL